jgi:CheY-like chemotaxis protein
VAEDNPYNQALMEDLLPRRGHSVHLACDGRAVLTALKQNHFDVMLLDIHMPELDGFQVVTVQRQSEQGTGRHLPIIALTAQSVAGERERCLQAGMDDYLTKPVRAAELFTAIDRVVSGQPASSGVMSSESSELGEVTGPFPSPGVLDTITLLAACDNDDELLSKMCGHFQTFAPDRLAEVTEALRHRDSARLQAATHKLGGIVSSFSTAAAEAAALLGRLGSEGKFEEGMQVNSRLADLLGKLLAMSDTLSVEQLQRERQQPQDLVRRVSPR